MRKILLSTSAVVLSLTAAGAADTSSVMVADYIVPPETVTVIATRSQQPIEITGESVSVVTGKDLDTQQIDAVSDALQQLPGIEINRNGPLGQQATISIRGAEPGQTIFMVDGIRINDPSATDGIALIGDVLVNSVDRIDVLRGPQSTLYGSDAIGGVVNIVTKTGHGEDPTFTLSAEGGSFNTVHINGASQGTIGRLDYGIGLNYFDTRGVSAADSAERNHEPDPYKNLGATANMRFHATDTISVDLRGYYSNGHAAFDDGSQFSPPFRTQDSGANNRQEVFAGYAGVNLDLFDGMFKNRFAIIATEDRRAYYDSAFDSIHLNSDDFGNALRFEYQGIVNVDEITQFVFGAETEHTGFRGDSFSTFFGDTHDRAGKHISGYYVQGQRTFFDQLTLTGGVRLDDDSTFGTHTSEKIAAAWRVPFAETLGLTDATLHANYGTGFKAPSLFQEFSEFSPPTPTVAALKPESAHGWEIGLATTERLFGREVHTTLTYFERKTTNMIDFVNCPGLAPGCDPKLNRPFGYYDNIGKTRSTGTEATLDADLVDRLNLKLAYTNLSAVDVTTSPSQPLTRKPKNEGSAVLTWSPTDDWNVGASFDYVGSRFDGGGEHLVGYGLVGLFGSWQVCPNFELFAHVDNLTDRHYEPEFGYGAEGRAAYLGIRVHT
jgi:vitamin B12 transporter